MPYIHVDKRTRLARNDGSNQPRDAGELNYLLAKHIDQYLENNGFNYQLVNDVVGVLECLKHEFCRRFVDIYEDFKCNTNGEVFHFMSERIKEIKTKEDN